jgi:AcrR family transcriptional regulator
LALVEVVAERGFAGTTVGLVGRRAGVPARVFYERFDSLEDCFLAMMDDGLRQVAKVMLDAFAAEGSWIDGLRGALTALLTLFDSNPQLARVWHLETLCAGEWALRRRERNLALLRHLILKRWCPPGEQAVVFASEGVMAAVLGVLQSRLSAGDGRPLIELLGPLMGLIVAPFVDADTRAKEVRRAEHRAVVILQSRSRSLGHAAQRASNGAASAFGRAESEPSPLILVRSRRAWECVDFLVRYPSSTNRQVAAGVGIVHESQVSRLLRQLEENGLVSKRALGVGKPNAWCVTETGEAALAGSPAADCISGRPLTRTSLVPGVNS